MATATKTTETLPNAARLESLLAKQQRHALSLRTSTAAERREKLQRLRTWIMANRPAIQEAMYQDFRKSATEVDLSEIFPTINAIKDVSANLSVWMRPKKVGTPLPMLGTSSRVMYEPKGVALIIAPWNYPFFLIAEPLVSAIAAGCCAVLKPSEMTPHTSALIARMAAELFDEQEVAVVEGDAEVASQLLKLPFDHIFFTGSPQIGKVVMRAAAENLTSVTLELGGKSPTIVDETADVADAAEKIVAGKFLNCGQTCLAPDYLLVHESKRDALVEALQANIRKFYGEDAAQSPDYTRIVNARHRSRLQKILDDAIAKGADVITGGTVREAENYIAPTLLTHVTDDMLVMQEEIFGPVLPILTYRQPDEAVRFVNQRPKPLGFYVFGRDQQRIDYFLRNTTAGGVTINDCILHVANNNLPFGGVNNSGIGKAHGHYGFLAFSNEKAVLRQRIGWTSYKMLYPPHTEKVKKMVNQLLRWM
ncbi:MAG: aldehyde dehydrogenase family protein [Cytophagales bacterium]|jgi:aldehyde dehydrogenase (NAD+)|nr:aldehyde dehydrogenase family protein [Cytophagales bacterium]